MEMLQGALRYSLKRISKGNPLLMNVLDPKDRDQAISVVERLCDLEVWSTGAEEDLKAMRSNAVKNVTDRFPKYSWKDLVS